MRQRPTLLLTRPEASSKRFLYAIRRRAGSVPAVISPLLRIVPRDVQPDFSETEALILTSAHAVPAAACAQGMTTYCVGKSTARAARAAGLRAIPAEGDAEALVALIVASAPQGRLMHLHGAETRGQIGRRLTEAGLDVDCLVVYDQVPQPLSGPGRSLLAQRRPVVAPVFSPRSAALLSEASRNARAPLTLVAISDAADAAWQGPQPQRRVIAPWPDGEAMLETVHGLIV